MPDGGVRVDRVVPHRVQELLGRDGDLVARMVWCAEQGAVTLDALHAAIERLPAIPKRRIWASYAALTRPQAPCNP